MNGTTRTIQLALLSSFVLVAEWIGAAPAGFKTRAIWVEPASFATAAATDKMIARCQQAGLNLILPSVMVYQTVAFKSSHFQGKFLANDTFDPLAYVITKAHAVGIKVQPWCCVYYEGTRDGAKTPLHPDWSTISIAGKRFDKNFISPANPAVNPYLLSVMKDLLAYDIDGIHLDYIRYPGGAFDYSDAARAAFKLERGFDPQDFLDHPERIVSPESEPYPIRVLQPRAHAEKVWETTAIERTLDQAGLGYAFLSESAANLTRLRAPGLLILSSYDEVTANVVAALEDFVRRGGTILWTDLPARSLGHVPTLQKLTGLKSGRWVGAGRVSLKASGNHPLGAVCSEKAFRTEAVSELTTGAAQVVARYDNNSPAIAVNEVGRGRVITLGFHLMKSTAPEVAELARRIVDWCQSEAGVTAANPLAPKRAEWFNWRADRVTQLVRNLSVAAKQKNAELVISSSGGPSPFEFFACYRDARRWLAEGINDESFPMNYTPDPEVLDEMLTLQTASAPAGTLPRIFPGLQLYATRTVAGVKEVGPQDPKIVAAQLRVVQQHGYQGFCLFAYNSLTDEILEVVRRFTE